MDSTPTVLDRATGCLVGLAAGDAMGTTLEFAPRRDVGSYHTKMVGGGPFNLLPGEWTDDTSQALALADSLIQNNGQVVKSDLLGRFSDWYETGRYSSNGRCFDIGNQTRRAIAKFRGSGQCVNGASPGMQGNGGIMRLAPAAIAACSESEALRLSVEQSRTTHASPVACVQAGNLGTLLFRIINGDTLFHQFRDYPFLSWPRSRIRSSGRCTDTMKAAMWAVARTSNFRDAIVEAVNLGDDADSVGAVAGQIAGALYGLQDIPEEWLSTLTNSAHIIEVAQRLHLLSYQVRMEAAE